jgi:hypothetical protein
MEIFCQYYNSSMISLYNIVLRVLKVTLIRLISCIFCVIANIFVQTTIVYHPKMLELAFHAHNKLYSSSMQCA